MAEETTNNENTEVNDPFSNKSMFNIDKGLGAVMGAKAPKTVDTENIDKAIAGLEKPVSGSVYDKLAARYRSQGEGALLRTQKNLANLFLPTINLIQEREADALARYTLLKNQLEDFDDSTIFGQADGTEMPIVDEIKNLANMTKEDMRKLSRLNPADERYDELAKKIQKNNDAIAQFDDINQKLLEIRNAQDGSDDASQWSKGMTQTERDMWMDIYSGKGNNIKIQDGKLVWTDTRADAGYNFEFTQEFLKKAAGSGDFDETEEFNIKNRTKEGRDLYILSMSTDERLKNPPNAGYIKMIQEALNTVGVTDNNGNKLDVDGDWGDKSKEAYKNYLKQKNELETSHLDKNLTEEEKQKYSKKTGVGQTRVIDLNNISSGPTMIENSATILERKIQGGVQDLINAGVSINDPNYQGAVKSMIFQLNQTGPAGIKSLIFDGLNTDDDDIFTSENTNSFIEGVIANNAKEFGIEDPDNITPRQLEDAIEKLKQGDVTIQYLNKDGKKESLQRQFLDWYKELIDTKVETGVKSRFSSTTGKITKSGGSGGRSGRGGNKNKPTSTPSSFEDYTSTYGDGKTYLPSTPISLPTYNANGQPILDANNQPVTRRVDADQIEITFENGQPFIQFDPDDENTKFNQSRSEIIDAYVGAYGEKNRKNIEKFVDEQINISKNKETEKLKTEKLKTETSSNVIVEDLNFEITDNSKISHRTGFGNQAIRPVNLLKALQAINVTSIEEIKRLANTSGSRDPKIKQLKEELKKDKYNVNITSVVQAYLKDLLKVIKNK